jgi:hypothetical protein
MKKKQHIAREQRMIRKPTIGTAITTPKFRFEELGVAVVRERLDGRRDWVKILVGSMLNALPITVLKWQL